MKDVKEIFVDYLNVRCSNCKHWDTEKVSQILDDIGYGVCNKAIDISDFGKEHPIKLNHAIVADYDGYAADLITGEDFGCIQFEAK